MANEQKIEEVKQSITDWEAKRASGMNPEIVDEIVNKLKAELAELEG